ncbi:MAG TPA: cytochrome D1 domain-containing protein [Rhodoferax sp.]|nr:cytochrome D1 domain-containing protein [Rhodoferax sp.]HNV60563.1 cytochrome D1 domain-containing protein [Rhodoferax sp.]
MSESFVPLRMQCLAVVLASAAAMVCAQPVAITMAASADGKFIVKATEQPATLVLMDAQRNVLKLHTVMDKNGKSASRVAAVYDAPARKSFVVALRDVPEVWEVSYDPTAEDIPVGMVHDFQYKEGAFIPGYLNPRRSYLPQPVAELVFTPDYSEFVATVGATGKRVRVNLDVRRQIANLD